ncbi:MAG: hypothetical protein GF331_23115 [Chitinivibrionales bacterium]|nr:hypothetical protein [Chitinivibrionales bacterium]
MKTAVAALLLALAFLAAPGDSSDYVIVVNTGSGVTSMRISDVKRLYVGKMRRLGDHQAVPVNQPLDAEITEKFLRDIVGMTIDEYKEFWIEQQVKGGASPPMIQRTDESVVAIVSAVPGAIGYVSPGADISNVKKLRLE